MEYAKHDGSGTEKTWFSGGTACLCQDSTLLDLLYYDISALTLKAKELIASAVHPALLNFSPRWCGWLVNSWHTVVESLPMSNEKVGSTLMVMILPRFRDEFLVSLLNWNLSFRQHQMIPVRSEKLKRFIKHRRGWRTVELPNIQWLFYYIEGWNSWDLFPLCYIILLWHTLEQR